MSSILCKRFRENWIPCAQLLGDERVWYSNKEDAAIEKLEKAEVSDIKAISAAQLEIIAAYYNHPHKQCEESFQLVRVAAIVCIHLFVAAGIAIFLKAPENWTCLSAAGGAASAFFGAVFSTTYHFASKQALAFKPQIDTIQRFIMANSACETLEKDKRQEVREKIIEHLFNC